MQFRTMAGLALICTALAGCEEFAFNETTPEEQAFLDLQDQTLAIRGELEDLSETTYTDLPTSGGAEYVGTAVINLETPATSELLGDASIAVNFATDRVTGALSGFHGTVDGGSVVAYDGTIVLSNGVIAARDSSYIDAQANGTLTHGDQDIDVGAVLNGGLYGETSAGLIPPVGIDLNSAEGSVFTLDGADVGGSLEIVGISE